MGGSSKTVCPISGGRYVAVTVKNSVCFAGLNCKCFEGRAWLLCIYMWVWFFYTVLNVTQELLCEKPWVSVLWNLEKCFSWSREINTDSDLNTGAVQRHNLLWTSGHNCFLSVVTKQCYPHVLPQWIPGMAVISMSLCPKWCWDGFLDQLRKKKLHCTLCQLLAGMPSLITSHLQFWPIKQLLALQRVWIRNRPCSLCVL